MSNDNKYFRFDIKDDSNIDDNIDIDIHNNHKKNEYFRFDMKNDFKKDDINLDTPTLGDTNISDINPSYSYMVEKEKLNRLKEEVLKRKNEEYKRKKM